MSGLFACGIAEFTFYFAGNELYLFREICCEPVCDWSAIWVAVNSTHGQLDTCVELTHLQKSQLDTSQLDTGVNSTHGQLDTTRHILSNLTAQH